jgi:uncharacterized membrane protein
LRAGGRINAKIPENRVAFRWAYIVLPVALLVLSLVLTAIFYRYLPEQVAYHFQDSQPDKWVSRGAFITWMLLPQVFLTLLAFMIVRMVLLGARYWPPESKAITRLLPVMGNMAGLPQIILTFTILDIFLYNAYQIKLLPVWVVAVIIMAAGGIGLGVFFIKIIRQARRERAKSQQE